MKTRILSGIVLAIFMAVVLFTGKEVMAVAFSILSCIGFTEITRATKNKSDNHEEKKFIGKLNILEFCGIVGTLIYYSLLYFAQKTDTLTACLIGILVVFLLTYVFTFPKFTASEVFNTYFAFIYATVVFAFFYRTREFSGIFDTQHFETGFYAAFVIIISSWISDTCAYFVGVCIGKHKIFPVLSPKKSLEGCIGGVIGSGIFGCLYGLLLHEFNVCGTKFILYFGIMCMCGSVIGQIGDLAASGIKRNFGIKDYGKLIPGHGGVMDRFDSMILISPLVYYICYYLLK